MLLLIITDGLENASTDFTRERVLGMITTQQDVYKWAFLFLAANQDAIAEGARIGIGAQQSMSFAATAAGIDAASRSLSEAVSAFRSTGESRLKRACKEEGPLKLRADDNILVAVAHLLGAMLIIEQPPRHGSAIVAR